MAWVKFTDRFDYRPSYGVVIAYKPGTYNVPRACATLAVAAGKAVRLKKTNKDEDPTYAHVDTREYVEDGWCKVERVGEPVFLVESEANGG